MVCGGRFFRVLSLVGALVVATPSLGMAEGGKISAPRFSFKSTGEVRFVPYQLGDGGTFTLISAPEWRTTANEVRDVVMQTHQRYQRNFGQLPKVSASIRLMDDEQFYKQTGAPRWTNAMYYRGEIVIPLSPTEPIDKENLTRSVKHEYTHAVLHALSGGKCPGWVDEGIAQLAEGEVHPLVEPALRRWLLRQEPVALSLLQGGFTGLATEMVPAAYAQSLISARVLLKAYGWEKMKGYLSALSQGTSGQDAFQASFGISESTFEHDLGVGLHEWALDTERSGSDVHSISFHAH